MRNQWGGGRFLLAGRRAIPRAAQTALTLEGRGWQVGGSRFHSFPFISLKRLAGPWHVPPRHRIPLPWHTFAVRPLLTRPFLSINDQGHLATPVLQRSAAVGALTRVGAKHNAPCNLTA
jgi:hypothetical protein